jgi:adenylosuccinate synthase
MASKKKKAAKAGAGAIGAAQAARSNPYVQRLVDDDELRDNLRTAYESAKNAYERMSNGKGPATKAILDDKKTQKELKEAASSLKDAADALRGSKKKKKGGAGKKLLLLIVGAGAALALSEGLRKKVLDTLFGAEEEFEYTSTTTPSSTGSETPVGTS